MKKIVRFAASGFCFPFALSAQVVTNIEHFDKEYRSLLHSNATASEHRDYYAPQILDDELFDIGLQYLLVEQKKRSWFSLSSDFRFSFASNATFVESAPDSTTLAIFTNTLLVNPEPGWERWGGRLSFQAGLSYQNFRYGQMDGTSKGLSGLAADLNDFDAILPYISLDYQRGEYFGYLGLRYLRLENVSTNEESYHEFVPYWALGRQIMLSEGRSFLLIYDGNLRRTNTESGGLSPEAWNDRTDHAFSAAYRVVFKKWILEPKIRSQYTYYMHRDRERHDGYLTFLANAYYPVFRNALLTLFASYEFRETTESISADYEAAEIGINASIQFRF